MHFARNNTESQCSFNPVPPNRNILQGGTMSQPDADVDTART